MKAGGAGAGLDPRRHIPRPPTALAYPEVVSRTRNPVRQVFHVGVAVFGWLVFGLSWLFIFARRIGHDAILTFLMLGLAFLGIVVINLLWITFNVGIHRMRGSRTHVRHVPFHERRDCMGRRLVMPEPEVLQSAPFIRVTVSPHQASKTYEPREPRPLPPAEPATPH